MRKCTMDNRSNRFCRWLLLGALFGAIASSPTWAQKANNGNNNPNGNNRNNGNRNNAQQDNVLETLRQRLTFGPNGLPAPADITASIEARRELDSAQEQLQKSMLASSSSPFAMENELGKSQEYRDLQLELRRAQSDYDMVRKPIIDALKEQAYYKALESKRDESSKVMNSLVVTGRGTFDWLYPHAIAALDINRKITSEQIRALLSRPEVEDAHQRVIFAAIKLRAMRTDWDQKFRSSDALRNAKADLESARQRVATARQAVVEALNKEAEYEQMRQMYLVELAKRDKRGN